MSTAHGSTAAVPEGFALLDSRSHYLETVGPFYGKPEGTGLIIGLRVAPKHLNRRSVVHGGMICSFVDFAMGEAARRTSDPPRAYVTANLSTEFAGNAREGDWIEARSDVMHAGRRVVFINCFVYRENKRIARASGTFIVVEGSDVITSARASEDDGSARP